MNTVGITSTITGPNCDNSWYLTVSRRNLSKFQKTIGFGHPEKKLLLGKILNVSKSRI
jgi:hypothetical protein